jgi:hypothetical protein
MEIFKLRNTISVDQFYNFSPPSLLYLTVYCLVNPFKQCAKSESATHSWTTHGTPRRAAARCSAFMFAFVLLPLCITAS